MRRAAAWMGAALVLAGCSGSTGSDLVEFKAFASGPADAVQGAPYRFTTTAGYEVTLDRARLHVGALYLNRAIPVLGAQETSCILPGVYAAQVTAGVTFDALSPTAVSFPVLGQGTSDHAVAGEVWLTGGKVDAQDDKTVILDVAGLARREGTEIPFEGTVTIGTNRTVSNGDPAQPGANPLCKERIVSPIPIDVTPTQGGSLIVTAHPAAWFDRVDFAQLPASSSDAARFVFPDAPEGQPSLTLFQGLHQVTTAFTFSWGDKP